MRAEVAPPPSSASEQQVTPTGPVLPASVEKHRASRVPVSVLEQVQTPPPPSAFTEHLLVPAQGWAPAIHPHS